MALRRAILALLTLASVAAPADRPAIATDPAQAGGLHEARLRKLHLVRPDLIHYPVAFDVVC